MITWGAQYHDETCYPGLYCTPFPLKWSWHKVTGHFSINCLQKQSRLWKHPRANLFLPLLWTDQRSKLKSVLLVPWQDLALSFVAERGQVAWGWTEWLLAYVLNYMPSDPKRETAYISILKYSCQSTFCFFHGFPALPRLFNAVRNKALVVQRKVFFESGAVGARSELDAAVLCVLDFQVLQIFCLFMIWVHELLSCWYNITHVAKWKALILSCYGITVIPITVQ